ncbi:sel1 repeat family protein [Pelomyxa schiedti]|nr:sel1 repeat family protein [Pelomyxa schiedti]
MGGQSGVERDLAKAFQYYLSAAERGHASSQACLGLMYQDGRGVKKNEEEARELAKAFRIGKGTASHLPNPTLAVKFYKLAADKGDRTAQECLGLMYLQGAGEVVKQYPLAVQYLRLAAKAGGITAQNNLALCYNRGYGVPVDLTEAFRLHTLSATCGDRTAQFNVAVCYTVREGAGTRDVREALRWYRLAAEHGHATSVAVTKLVRTGTDILAALRTASS